MNNDDYLPSGVWQMKAVMRRILDGLNECELGLEDLRPIQLEKLIPFLIANPKSAAYVDMGFGKTVSILTLLDILFWSGQMRRTLIVAPKRVAVQTWPNEIEQWRHTYWMRNFMLLRPDYRSPEVTSAMRVARQENPLSPNHAAQKVKTMLGKRQMRAKSLTDFPVHIINREQVVFLVEYWMQATTVWPYDCIIIDESTSFADHTSKRWKAMAWACRRSKRVHLLSGTPAPEGISDLFAQIYLLDHGRRFGRSITTFRKNYMDHNEYTKVWTAKPGAAERVTEKCADICMIIKEEEYLTREAPHIIERPITLSEKQLAAYKEFEETMILELPEGEEIEAVNAGVLAMKLNQYASGAVIGNDRTVHEVHDEKILELHQITEEMPGEPLLVSYWFKSSLSKLKKTFPHATVMDKDGLCLTAWNAGRIPMLLVHPQSAGHGLNMQKGPGHTLVFFDTPASLELYLQIIKRLDRPGQAKVVKVIHLIVKKTIDAFCVPRLENKESIQEEIVQYIRAIRDRVSARKLLPVEDDL